MRRRSIKERICLSVSSKVTDIVLDQICLIPLMFKKKANEDRWRGYNILPSWRSKNYSFLGLYCLTLVLLWLCELAYDEDSSLKELRSELEVSDRAEWHIHVVYGVTFCLLFVKVALTWNAVHGAKHLATVSSSSSMSPQSVYRPYSATLPSALGRLHCSTPAVKERVEKQTKFKLAHPAGRNRNGDSQILVLPGHSRLEDSFHSTQSTDYLYSSHDSKKRCLQKFRSLLRRNLDTISYFFFAIHLLTVSVGLWVIIFLEEGPYSALGDEEPASRRNECLAWALEMFVLFVQRIVVLLLIPWVAVAFAYQSKTSRVWPLLLLALVGISGAFALLGTKTKLTSQCVVGGGLSCVLVLASAVIRYMKELQERLEFLVYMQAQKRMTVLHQEVMRLSPVRGDTGVHGESTLEEMLSLLKQTKNLLTVANSQVQSPEAMKAMDIVKEVVKTMSIGGDLFKVRFANIGEEGESIIDQYIRGGHKKSNPDATSPEMGNCGGEQVHASAEEASAKDTKQARQAVMNTKRMRTTNVGFECYIGGGPGTAGAAEVASAAPHTGLDFKDILFADMENKVGVSWKINVFEFVEQQPDILIQFGAALLTQYCGFLGISVEGLLGFLASLQECYWDNAYHNRIHAAFVAHATCCFANMLAISQGTAYTELTEIVYVTASLGHDVGHPSRNNQFFVNTYDPLAVIYNDVSVLENYHAFLTFQILDNGPCDIFGQLTVTIYREARRRIIEIILATDMKEHFESISKYRIRRSAAGFHFRDDPDDMWHCLRIIVKAADLSHGCVEWDQHFLWSCLIQEEFYQQGEEEKSLGQPISPLCDRETHPSFAKSQKGFLEFVVAPLFTELKETDSTSQVNVCLDNLWANKEQWTLLEASGEYVVFPEYVRKYQEKRKAELRAGGGLKAMWLYVNRLAAEHNSATPLSSASRSSSSSSSVITDSKMRRAVRWDLN